MTDIDHGAAPIGKDEIVRLALEAEGVAPAHPGYHAARFVTIRALNIYEAEMQQSAMSGEGE